LRQLVQGIEGAVAGAVAGDHQALHIAAVGVLEEILAGGGGGVAPRQVEAPGPHPRGLGEVLGDGGGLSRSAGRRGLREGRRGGEEGGRRGGPEPEAVHRWSLKEAVGATMPRTGAVTMLHFGQKTRVAASLRDGRAAGPCRR